MDIDEDDQEAFVKCGTTKGPFTIRLVRKWSPLGYDRAVSLFQRGFYDQSHFFRTVPGFLVQFGISYTDEEDLLELADETIRDDPQLDPPIPFEEGTVSYAGGGKDSRTSQLFIAYDAIDSFVSCLGHFSSAVCCRTLSYRLIFRIPSNGNYFTAICSFFF